MPVHIEIDFESFVAYAERGIRYSDGHFPPPTEGVGVIGRKLCDLGLEARDRGVFLGSGMLILLARCMLCATKDELVEVIKALTMPECCQEFILGWAEDAGVKVIDGPDPTRK